jgi:DNA-directed RNA polymerase specialized sigma24 family protein
MKRSLDRFSATNARQGKVVELCFFGGLSVEEIAEFLAVSPKTVKRDRAVAKVWLHRELRCSDGDLSGTMGES